MDIKSEDDVFTDAMWIGKNYKLIHHRRKRNESESHFVSAKIRRSVDRFYFKRGYQNREWLRAPYFRKVVEVKNIQKDLDCVEAKTTVQQGEVIVKWERNDKEITLTVSLPDGIGATVFINSSETTINHSHTCKIVDEKK